MSEQSREGRVVGESPLKEWGSSYRMEGSGVRQVADVKPRLKSYIYKKELSELLGLETDDAHVVA